MATILRVLIGQKKYITVEHGDVIKIDEFQTFNYNGHDLPKIGGVIEDRIYEKLGYVFNPSKYDEKMNRKQEHFIPYNYTNPFSVRIDKDTIEKYEIKKEREMALV